MEARKETSWQNSQLPGLLRFVCDAGTGRSTRKFLKLMWKLVYSEYLC